MKHCCILLLTALLLLSGCGKDSESPTEPSETRQKPGTQVFTVEALKWYGGRKAAVSITYDALWGQWRSQRLVDYVTNEVLLRGLRMDYEMVTEKYDHPEYEFIVTDIRENVIPSGVHFFGHGHEHVYHDSLTYDEAFESFSRCYGLMEQWGLNPRAYGYPHSSGRKPEIQRANMLAGFICARGAAAPGEEYCICTEDETEPENWYYLPSIQAGQTSPDYIQDHSEMEPFLKTALDRGAWVILLYHAIGFPDDYCYYPINEFLKDMDYIAGNDFWGGNMDMTACYIRERNQFYTEVTPVAMTDSWFEYDVVFGDGLDNATYDQPLTLEFTFDPSETITGMEIDPAVESGTEFTLEDNILRLNIVPNEQKYRLRLIRNAP